MKKFLIAAVLLFVLGCIALYLLFTGPEMAQQQSVKTFETSALSFPSGTTPFIQPPSTETNIMISDKYLKEGEKFYDYYCVFCHGSNGDGNGPVGDSYIPKPSDLRRKELASLNPQDMIQKMIEGPAHSPVLKYTIPVEYYNGLYNYVRKFSLSEKQ